MKKKLMLLSIMLFTGCVVPKHSGSQGITGVVRWVEGNLMPAVGDTTYTTRAKGVPIQREIYIYKAVKIHDAESQQGVFFHDIPSELIARVQTDSDGIFNVSLSPGTYSVFVMEDEGLFANKYDGEGFINPVTISANSYVNMEILINYKAYY